MRGRGILRGIAKGTTAKATTENRQREPPMPTSFDPPHLDTAVPVLLLKVSRNAIQHGAVGAIRTLGRLGVPVYAVVEDPFAPAARSRYLAGAFIPDDWAKWQDAPLAGLEDIGKNLRRKAILVPTEDLASVFIAEHSESLEKWFVFPRPPSDLPRRLANKTELYPLCAKIGVPCPETAFPSHIDDVRAFLERAVFPVVVKAPGLRRLPRCIPSVSIARTPGELLALYQRAEDAGIPDLILQEYIPEACGEDWIYHGYTNPENGCRIGFTGKKLRSYPPFRGVTTLGATLPNHVLSRQTERLLDAISYAGIMDIDYRFDKRDGRYKLLDFNPRVGANFRLFEDRAGLDVVRALHLDLTGRSIGPLRPYTHRTFKLGPYDLLATFGYLRSGDLTFRTWWRSRKGRRKERAWFHWDDPVPFFLMCARLSLRTMGRFLQASRARLPFALFTSPPAGADRRPEHPTSTF